MLPLDGIKVIDMGQALIGPLSARILGDLGAEVLKVEPLQGDFTRLTPRPGADSVSFLVCNRSKRSLAVNLQDERGLKIVLQLIKDADVLLHNFRPGVMQKMGLDYEKVRQVNPKIIYQSSYMYGEEGPWSRRRGGDPSVQAMTGMVASQGSPGGPPYLAAHPVTDFTGGVINALGIITALFMRDRTGIGQEVVTNLINAGAFLQEIALTHYLFEGVLYNKGGRGSARGLFPYGAYTAKDGDVVTLFGQDDDEWKDLCGLLGIEQLLKDERYKMQAQRTERRFELYPILDKAFSKKTRAEWEALFKAKALRCDAALDYAEFVAHPQFQANDMIVEVDHHREGKVKMLNQPIKFKGIPPFKPTIPSPVLGEHSKEVLLKLGYSEAEIKTLHDEGVVGIPSVDMFKSEGRPSGAWSPASTIRTKPGESKKK